MRWSACDGVNYAETRNEMFQRNKKFDAAGAMFAWVKLCVKGTENKAATPDRRNGEGACWSVLRLI